MREISVSLPPVLEKATVDTWYFALETKTGQQFIFGSVSVIDENWIHLEPVSRDYAESLPFDGPVDGAYRITERGIDVRLDSIAWVADGIS